MNREMRTCLRVLGFHTAFKDIPPSKVISQQFRKECLLKHPDKPTGDKEAFQELLDAYSRILRYLRASGEVDVEVGDVEDKETLKRKYFQQFSLYGN